jgi:predicted amidophosphoribosyltransferase
MDQWFHQVKQLNDEVLAAAWLTPHRRKLRQRLRGAYLVYVPSTPEQTQRRGFFALEALYAPLGLEIHHHLRKSGHEQKGLSAFKRKSIGAAIELEKPLPHRLNRIVLMEDVVTTGATVQSCVRCLAPFSPSVEVLCIAVHPLWLKKA